MKTKILLLCACLLAGTISVNADDGTLSIANVRSAVPGYSGSLDIVLSGATTTYRDFQFDLTLPEGLTFSGYAVGELIDGHSISTSDQGDNTRRFIGDTDATKTLTSTNGTLLTIYFTVDPGVSTGDKEAFLSDITLSDALAVSHLPTQGTNSVTVNTTVTLDENVALASTTINNVDVTMNRTIDSGKWSTICLPFSMTNEQLKSAFGNDVQLGDFTGYTLNGDRISVNFTPSTTITANHPYIIKVSSSITSFSVSNTNITPVTTPMNNKGENTDADKIKAIIGTYSPDVTVPDNCLFISNNTFKYSTGNAKLKGYRAYFQFCDFNYSTSSRSVILDDSEIITGIDEVKSQMKDFVVYDLQGRRVKHPTKGIYIQNGQKIIIK